ncbi:Rossmann-fold NAD(P)-binding domain-containing protein [Aureivirga marina]|uniref:hypothetical protein n=1 Tax=Aureivirga marina TaxID=1182451 RepID=UPI0018CB6924|nr:hypothetical protein [Aureivirga marina]
MLKNRKISYISPTTEIYQKSLKEAGVPEQFIELMNGIALAQAQGEFDEISDDLKNILGRNPATLKDFLVDHFSN